MKMPFISLIKLNGKTLSTEEAGQQRRWSQKLGRTEQEKKAGPQLKWFRMCIILKAVVSVVSEEGLVIKQYGRHQQLRPLKWKRPNKPKYSFVCRENILSFPRAVAASYIMKHLQGGCV